MFDYGEVDKCSIPGWHAIFILIEFLCFAESQVELIEYVSIWILVAWVLNFSRKLSHSIIVVG